MIEEKEITVRVKCSYEELDKILTKQNFTIREKYQVNDVYMINRDIDLNSLSKLDILKKCILVRDIVDIEKLLLYKCKEYNEKGEILKQGKVKCPIVDITKAISFMEAINYEKLINISDTCIIYCNDETELNIQLVNDKYIFIEMEDKPEYVNKVYNSTTELIEELNKYSIPYEENNYYVKKAELILNEKNNLNCFL